MQNAIKKTEQRTSNNAGKRKGPSHDKVYVIRYTKGAPVCGAHFDLASVPPQNLIRQHKTSCRTCDQEGGWWSGRVMRKRRKEASAAGREMDRVVAVAMDVRYCNTRRIADNYIARHERGTMMLQLIGTDGSIESHHLQPVDIKNMLTSSPEQQMLAARPCSEAEQTAGYGWSESSNMVIDLADGKRIVIVGAL